MTTLREMDSEGEIRMDAWREQFVGKTKAESKQAFDSGATRSDRTGKGRFDLISPFALERLARRYEEGAEIHGDRNWEQGYRIGRCIDGALRHLNQYKQGMRDEDHLAAAAWNVFAAMHFEELIARGILSGELDDAPNYGSRADERSDEIKT